jgi:hypothetical protein
VLCPHAVQAIGLFRGQEGAAPGGGVGSGEGGGGDSAETGEGGSGSRGTLGQSLLNQMQERLGVQQRVTMVAPEDMATVCSNEGERWLALWPGLSHCRLLPLCAISGCGCGSQCLEQPRRWRVCFDQHSNPFHQTHSTALPPPAACGKRSEPGKTLPKCGRCGMGFCCRECQIAAW